jgi:hypothetical protein
VRRIAAAAALLLLAAPCAGAQPVAVARTASLELLFDPGNGDVTVRDLRAGELWSSNPPLTAGDRSLSEALLAERGSPFLLSFRDSDMKVAYTANRQSAGVTFAWEKIPGGVRAQYSVSAKVDTRAAGGGSYAGTLSFAMEYVLEGDALRVIVPGDSVKEAGSFIIVSLQVLPFFGATADASGGALILPDGSGAAAAFRPPAAQSSAFFSLPVYGEERFTFAPRRRPIGSLSPDELAAFLAGFDPRPAAAALPVFGLLRRGRGIAAVIDGGEMYARVRGALPGVIFDLARVCADFDYRVSYVSFLSRQKTETRYLRTLIPGDRSVRYVFLPGPGAGIAEIAAAARGVLAVRAGVTVGAARAPGLDIRIFCGVTVPRPLGRRLVVATTFDQAAEIARDARSRGFSNLSVTLVGWQQGGWQGALPRSVPPERLLGGEAGLRRLVRACHEIGAALFLEVDYLLAVPGAARFNITRDSIQAPNKIAITDGAGTYLVSPRAALERFAPSDIAWLKDVGVDGLSFRHAAGVLLGDYGHGITREQSAGYASDLLRLARAKGLQVRAEGGGAWALGSVDAFYGIPLAASGYPFAAEDAPLYVQTLHGTVGLITAPLNGAADLRGAVLRSIGLGVTPSVEVIAADPGVLRDTPYNGLYRARYREVLDEIAVAAAPASRWLPGLAGAVLSARTETTAGLSATRFGAAGTILANTGAVTLAWSGTAVPAASAQFQPGGTR